MKKIKRIIIKIKIIEKGFYRKIYQKMADMLILKLKNTVNESEIDHILTLGNILDFYAKSKNIYLK